MKIAIAFPSSTAVEADFAVALANLCIEEVTERRRTIKIFNVQSSTLAPARNELVRQALEWGADKLLFVDSDMVFPPNALQVLLALDKDIVGASYLKKATPMTLNFVATVNADVFSDERLEKVLAIGAGFLLIDCNVFKRVDMPWFDNKYYERVDIAQDNFLRDLFFKKNINYPVYISEDYFFCAMAREVGYTVWMDKWLTYQMGHIGKQILKLPEPL